MKIRVCPTCHANPCECMTAREWVLLMAPVFAGFVVSAVVSCAVGLDPRKGEFPWFIPLGVLPGFAIGFYLSFRFGGRRRDD